MQFTEDTSALGQPAPGARRLSHRELAALLAEEPEAVAVALFGEKPTSRNDKELRFSDGSITVGLTGRRKGKVHDFKADTDGDLLDLARQVHGQESGLEWVRRRCGGGFVSELDRVALATRVAKQEADRAAENRKADEDAARKCADAQAIWDAAA
jgi:hypothetical protein